MVRLNRNVVCCLLSIVGATYAKSSFVLRDKVRDFAVEGVIAHCFLMNSDHIIEVDSTHYPDLDTLVTNLAQKASVAKPLIFVITKKIPFFFAKVNAFTCGDKDKSVVFVGSWLLEHMSQAELENVLAHELMHLKHDHIIKGMKYNICCSIASDAVCSIVIYGLFKQKGFLAVIYRIIASSILTAALTAHFSRKREKEADLAAIQLTGNKKLAAALAKLEGTGKKYMPFSQWVSTLYPHPFASHPKTEARIKYIEEAKIVTA